jgi:hypothetical protein
MNGEEVTVGIALAQTVGTIVQLLGAGGFGVIIGWYVYYINRYRKSDVQFSDLTTLIGILGGGAILALFPARSVLFGAYGIGLFLGFFGYFLSLVILVNRSNSFDVEWFLDGRRRKLRKTEFIPEAMQDAETARAMSLEDEATEEGPAHGGRQG